MFSGRFILFLLLGTLFMMIPICIQTKWYGLRWWKSILIAFVLTVCGTLGTYLWFFAENFMFGGRSFYGAVFLVPGLFILVSFLFRIPYGNLMDLCAPAECMMLVLMKNSTDSLSEKQMRTIPKLMLSAVQLLRLTATSRLLNVLMRHLKL